jgi:hypothetical protein
MNRKFLPVVLLLATSVVYSADSSSAESSFGVGLQNFFERFSVRQAVSDLKVDIKTLLEKKAAGSAHINGGFADLEGFDVLPNAGSLPETHKVLISEKVLAAQKGAEAFLKKHPVVRNTSSFNGGFADLEAVDSLPSASNEGVVGGKIEQAKNYVKSLFAPQSAAAAEQEKKSLLTQISENPGTTAALTAGTLVALYGSYKLIQYFDKKKAKNRALAKRLAIQKKQLPVVFE